MHAYLRSLALGLALLLPAVPAFAADAPAKTDAAIPDKPTRITERNTPVAVEYEGNDSIGSRLARQGNPQLQQPVFAYRQRHAQNPYPHRHPA